jgi:hypothetical protein
VNTEEVRAVLYSIASENRDLVFALATTDRGWSMIIVAKDGTRADMVADKNITADELRQHTHTAISRMAATSERDRHAGSN